MTGRLRRRHVAGALLLGVAALTSCERQGTVTDVSTNVTVPPATSSATSEGAAVGTSSSSVAPKPSVATTSVSSIPRKRPVPAGELVSFTVVRKGKVLFEAKAADPVVPRFSEHCEVPDQPCYDPPLDRVARVASAGTPSYPGTNTTYLAGHSNRFHRDDPAKGVFTRLQDVRVGDRFVLRTTKGEFIYVVTKIRRVAFDKFATDAEIRRQDPERLNAFSCEISPSGDAYIGNFVAMAMLESSKPLG